MDSYRFDELKEYAEKWAKENLGENFTFRKHQLTTIVAIIDNVLKGVKTTVVESPTGSGKSLIGIISAGVLDTYFDKSSYILISDTSLFKQYENDIKHYQLDWGCLEGKDNYTCLINGQPWSSSYCQNLNKSLRYMLGMNPTDPNYSKFPCVKKCKYLREYKKARKSHVSIMTYQYLLSTYEKQKDDFSLYELTRKRDVVFCDEAHKLPDIIQTMFSPQINLNQLGYLKTLIKFSNDHTELGYTVTPFSKFDIVFDTMKAILNGDKTERDKRNDMLYSLKAFANYFETFSDLTSDIRNNSRSSPIEIDLKGNHLRKAAIQWLQDNRVLREYLTLIQKLGSEFCIASLVGNNETITFSCAKEPDMVRTFFHNQVGNEVLLSATIGNVDVYRETIGSDTENSFDAFEAPNTFDYSKSPIYYSTKHRLSYREKAANLPKAVAQIEDICNKHKNDRILIQTGSYEFSSFLYKNLSPAVKSRCLFHNTASEKKEALFKYETYIGKIMISPSMLEGWDGKDDKCRVIIIMKVPYASMSDKLVQAKSVLYPNWYSYSTVNKIIQGIGRGVRSETDYCTTYIVDACFNDLLTRNREYFPQVILDRLQPLD